MIDRTLVKLMRFMERVSAPVYRLHPAALMLLTVLFCIIAVSLGLTYGLRRPARSAGAVRARNISLLLSCFLTGFGLFRPFAPSFSSSFSFTKPVLLLAGAAVSAVSVIAQLAAGNALSALQHLFSLCGAVTIAASHSAMREPFSGALFFAVMLAVYCLIICAVNSVMGRYRPEDIDDIEINRKLL
ncbi:MAG: hypothetical protein IIY63_04995 [Oscillospiraceae bacterium]|nr:hypothetical protein [Oscillospiraceae bacterium]